MSLLIIPDEYTGIETVLHELEDGGIGIEHRQDAQDIIDVNRSLYNEVDERAPFGKHAFIRVASMPMTQYFKMLREGTLDDQKALHRWLNDPDNRYFRTRPGRI